MTEDLRQTEPELRETAPVPDEADSELRPEIETLMTQHTLSLSDEDEMLQSFTPEQDSDQLFAQLLAHVRRYHPSDDMSQIEAAYRLAKGSHDGQLRRSGEPYINH
ncbi:MAG: hypothetical protein ILP12_00980, partial [Lachnospiraceae bacterium]|nr:hypothetical protein [Lachnospiraceae bacterium]